MSLLPVALLTVVVPPFPRPLRTLTVGPTTIAELAVELLAASTRLDDTGELARTRGRLEQWEGETADAYRADLAPWGRRADTLSLALRAVGRRVEDHADTMRRLAADLEDLTTVHRRLVDEVFGLTDDTRRWRARAASATDDPAVVEEGHALRLRAERAGGAVRALDLAQDAWWERVVAEETAMVDAFAGVMERTQVEDRYGGASDPADAALATLSARGAPPVLVLAWWRSLTAAQRDAVLVAAPGAVGNRDGIPASARDAANRLRLARDLATLRHLDDTGDITEREAHTLDNAEAAEEALDRHAADVNAHGRQVPSYLWIYDPGAYPQAGGSVDGRVAVAIGDPDTADAIAVNVPGITTEASDIGEQADRAWELHQAATTADPDRSYAALAWIGYDAPQAATDDPEAVATAGAADRGGELLAASLDGLRAVGGADVEIVPIGHSYGSVALGSALSHHDLGVDRAVVVGSPGMGQGITDVGDLHLGRGQLFVGQNHDDPVADLGQNGAVGLGGVGHGQDPADSRFGGERFQANAAAGHDEHSAYYDNDSESLHNLGAILAGQAPTEAGAVEDPWFTDAHDPEVDAPSDGFDTDGDGDTDGVPAPPAAPVRHRRAS